MGFFLFKKIYLPLTALFFLLAIQALRVELPSKNKPYLFYSNQMRRDLKQTLLKSLSSANHSIYLSIYSLTDPQVIDMLSKKAEAGLDVQVLVDQKQTKSLTKKISKKVKIVTLKQKGLMHQKIFLIDDIIFVGSTNLTLTSLRMHDNLMAGFYFPSFSKCLKKELMIQSDGIVFSQPNLFKFYTLPNRSALDQILSLINSAKSSIKIAMFTFTHPKVLEALSYAKDRGVQIHVILDYLSHKGASKKLAKSLGKLNIRVSHNRGIQMMHHKLAIIDNYTIIMGSTNWTKSAFEKNQEALLFFNNLPKKDLQFITRLWKNLEFESKRIKLF